MFHPIRVLFLKKKLGVNFFRRNDLTGGVRGGFGKRPYFFTLFFEPFPNLLYIFSKSRNGAKFWAWKTTKCEFWVAFRVRTTRFAYFPTIYYVQRDLWKNKYFLQYPPFKRISSERISILNVDSSWCLYQRTFIIVDNRSLYTGGFAMFGISSKL